MGKNICKNISKSLSSKYSQKILDHAKQSAKDAFKTTSQRVIPKTAKSTGDLVKSRKYKKLHKQNNSETVTNEHDKEIPKERYISPEE